MVFIPEKFLFFRDEIIHHCKHETVGVDKVFSCQWNAMLQSFLSITGYINVFIFQASQADDLQAFLKCFSSLLTAQRTLQSLSHSASTQYIHTLKVQGTIYGSVSCSYYDIKLPIKLLFKKVTPNYGYFKLWVYG